MPPKPVFVVGAGGHATVILEMLLLRPQEFLPVGLTDAAAERAGKLVMGIPVWGDDGCWEDLRKQGAQAAIVGIGDNRLRACLADKLRTQGFRLVTVVHPAATVSPAACIGTGTAVMAGVIVNPGCMIGDNTVLNTACSVDHDAAVGPDAHVGPGACLGGNVRVGQGVLVGMSASILPGVKVGEWSRVGAGAVVTQDVPAGATVVGVPAKALRGRAP